METPAGMQGLQYHAYSSCKGLKEKCFTKCDGWRKTQIPGSIHKMGNLHHRVWPAESCAVQIFCKDHILEDSGIQRLLDVYNYPKVYIWKMTSVNGDDTNRVVDFGETLFRVQDTQDTKDWYHNAECIFMKPWYQCSIGKSDQSCIMLPHQPLFIPWNPWTQAIQSIAILHLSL